MSDVLFVTGTPSPFQVELGRAIRSAGIDYRIVFTAPSLGDRGAHWGGRSDEPWVSWNNGASVVHAAKTALDVARPKIALVGAIRGPLYEVCVNYCGSTRSLLGLYAEQPTPKSYALERMWDCAVGRRVRREVAFILAIGDRALARYTRWLARPQDTHLVAYYQDIDSGRNPTRTYERDRTKFVFSGRLLQRNQPVNLVRAFQSVASRFGDRVSLCFAAGGPEEEKVRAVLRADPDSAKLVRFDTEFSTWSDRLRPLKEADVLVLPARHSGWGLVIQEALAAGAAVISTDGVEAARHLVEHGSNGLLCSGDVRELVEAMVFMVENPDERIRMQRVAPQCVHQVTAENGGKKIGRVLQRYLNGGAP